MLQCLHKDIRIGQTNHDHIPDHGVQAVITLATRLAALHSVIFALATYRELLGQPHALRIVIVIISAGIEATEAPAGPEGVHGRVRMLLSRPRRTIEVGAGK